MKRLNYSSKYYADTKSWSGGHGYSMSAFIRDNGDFPYGFFGGLVGMIGLCLLSWTMYAKHQQALAVTDCIEAELYNKTAEASTQETVQSTERPAKIMPEDRLNRASTICEMKCIRGSLSGCQ